MIRLTNHKQYCIHSQYPVELRDERIRPDDRYIEKSTGNWGSYPYRWNLVI